MGGEFEITSSRLTCGCRRGAYRLAMRLAARLRAAIVKMAFITVVDARLCHDRCKPGQDADFAR